MKNNIVLIVIVGLVIWNVFLSLPQKKDESINYQLLQEVYKENERRFQTHELQINTLKNLTHENDSFVDNATHRQLDSLESIFFRR